MFLYWQITTQPTGELLKIHYFLQKVAKIAFSLCKHCLRNSDDTLFLLGRGVCHLPCHCGMLRGCSNGCARPICMYSDYIYVCASIALSCIHFSDRTWLMVVTAKQTRKIKKKSEAEKKGIRNKTKCRKECLSPTTNTETNTRLYVCRPLHWALHWQRVILLF